MFRRYSVEIINNIVNKIQLIWWLSDDQLYKPIGYVVINGTEYFSYSKNKTLYLNVTTQDGHKFTIKSNNFGILFELNATMFTIDEQQNIYEAKCNSTHCTATHKVSD